MRRHAFFPIDYDNKHFDKLANLLLSLRNPIFIGPNMSYSKSVLDSMVKQSNNTILCSDIYSIYTFIINCCKQYDKNIEIFDDGYYYCIINKVLNDLLSKEVDPVRINIIETILKSVHGVGYIADIFKDAYEIIAFTGKEKIVQDLSCKDIYPIIYDVMYEQPSSELHKILKDIIEKIILEIRKNYKKSNVYDIIGIYEYFANNIDKFSFDSDRTLVFSGFFYFTPIIKHALSKIFEKFDEIIFISWKKIKNNNAFELLDNVYNFLSESGFEFQGDTKEFETYIEKIKENVSITAVEVENEQKQYNYTAAEIKKLLINGESIDDIAIIIPKNINIKKITDELDLAKIPYRCSSSIILMQSRLVKFFINLLDVYFHNFDVDSVLTVLESAIISKKNITINEIEELIKKFGFFSFNASIGYNKNISKYRDSIIKKIDEEIDEIQSKIDQLSIEEDVYLSTTKYLQQLNSFKLIMNNFFDCIINIEKDDGVRCFFDKLKELIIEQIYMLRESVKEIENSNYNNKNIENVLVSEIKSIYYFIEIVDKVKKYINIIYQKNHSISIKNWKLMYDLLMIILYNHSYTDKKNLINVIDVVTLQDSIYLNKKYKFFVYFTDDYYPAASNINPFLFKITKHSNIFEYLEKNEQRNLILSITSSKFNYLIFPKSTITGEECTPSRYINKFFIKVVNYEFNAKDIYSYIDYEIIKSKKDKNNNVILPSDVFKIPNVFIDNFSFHKIQSYIKCPLKFYFQHVVELYNPEKDNVESKIHLNDGIIVHRVLKKFFSNINVNKNITEKNILSWIEEACRDIYKIDIYSYSIPIRIKVNEISKNIIPFLMSFKEKYKIIMLGYRTIGCSLDEDDKKTNKKIELISKQAVSVEDDFETNIDNIDFKARVDNINIVGLSNDNNENYSYAIIDYKYSNVRNSLIEQVLFYDWIVKNSSKKIMNSDDMLYCILFSLKPYSYSGEAPKYSYEYCLIQNNEIIFPAGKRGKIDSYLRVPYHYFEEWLKGIINDINVVGDFTPAFFLDRSRSFINFLSKKISKKIENDSNIIAPNGSVELQKCRSYLSHHYNCPFESICSLFELYSNVRLLM